LPMRNPILVAVGFNEQNVDYLHGHTYKVKAYPGQLRVCMVACGEVDITGINKGYLGGFESWDVAGPHAVLLAAGGNIITIDGLPMRYGKDSTKLPDHIAGGKDILFQLGINKSYTNRSGQEKT